MGEKREPLNIIIAASEAVPLAKTGGLADVVDAVGRGFADRGHAVALVLPKYRSLKTGGIVFEKSDALLPITVDNTLHPAALWRGRHEGVDVWLIENDHLFGRDELYGHDDDAHRFIFFSRAVLETAKFLEFKPDIVHSHDWQASLIAPMLKIIYAGDPFFKAAKSALTLHNLAFQGSFEPWTLLQAGFPSRYFTYDRLEHGGRFNFLKSGIQYTDGLTTVSPTYAREIQTPEFGMGLDGLLRYRSGDLRGILNGVDQNLWKPPYGPSDVKSGKAEHKAALQKTAGFAANPAAPLFIVTSRLTEQKGLDLIIAGIPEIIGRGAQIIVSGNREGEIGKNLEALARSHAESLYLHPYSDELVRRFFAGADFLLMPSRFEPCGLSQLIAQLYGTLPLVTRTGGLADTVRDIRDDPKRGDGFFIHEFSAQALTETVIAALEHYTNSAALDRSRRVAMAKDTSWDESIAAYLDFFYRLLNP